MVKLTRKALALGDPCSEFPLTTFKTLRSKTYDKLPPVKLDYEYADTVTKETFRKTGQSQLPTDVTQSNVVKLRYCLSYCSLVDVLAFHKSTHAPPTEIILSADNVPVNSSSLESFDVTCVQFPPCPRVYPLRVFHGKESVKLDGGTLPDFSKVPTRHWMHQVHVNQFLYSLLAEDKCEQVGVEIAYYEFPQSITKTSSGWQVDCAGFGTRRRVLSQSCWLEFPLVA